LWKPLLHKDWSRQHGSLRIQRLFVRFMYRSLYKKHEFALHGPTNVTLDAAARLITQRAEPHVKLH
jgi:NADH dehydrogenase